MTHDGPRHVTAGAVTRTIAHETGVAAIAVRDGSLGPVGLTIKQVRADGRNLEFLGILHALLAASKAAFARREDIRLVVHADAAHIAAVQAHLDHGHVVVPEALHQLTAIRKRVELCRGKGLLVTFEAGTMPLSADVAVDLADRLAREVEHVTATHTEKGGTPWQLADIDAAWVAEHDATVVYTDGSQMSPTGFASWAWWTADGSSAAGTVAAVTSTHAERLAVFKALRAHRGPVLVVSDMSDLLPSYGAGRTQDGGHERLKRRLRAEIERGNVRVTWVPGHDRCPGNIEADRLAGQALAAAWSRISTEPALADRLTAIYAERLERAKLARRAAGERFWLRRQSELDKRARRATATAALVG